MVGMDRSKPTNTPAYAVAAVATILIVALAGWLGIAIATAISPLIPR